MKMKMNEQKIGMFVFPVLNSEIGACYPLYGRGKFFTNQYKGFDWQEEQNDKEERPKYYWSNQLVRYDDGEWEG